MYKCDNKEIYDKALKGEITGFSIDGLFSLEKVVEKEKVNLNSDVMTKDDLVKFKEDLLSDFKAAFTKKEEAVEVKLGMATLKDGETQIEYMGEVLEANQDVFVVNGEDRAPLPVGEYELEDGSMLVVSEEGKVGEVKPMEEPTEEPVQEELSEEPTAPSADSMSEDIKQLMKSLTIKYAEETKQMVGSLEAKLSEQKEIIEELKKTPAAVALKSAPTQKEPTTAKERIFNEIQKHR